MLKFEESLTNVDFEHFNFQWLGIQGILQIKSFENWFSGRRANSEDCMFKSNVYIFFRYFFIDCSELDSMGNIATSYMAASYKCTYMYWIYILISFC